MKKPLLIFSLLGLLASTSFAQTETEEIRKKEAEQVQEEALKARKEAEEIRKKEAEQVQEEALKARKEAEETHKKEAEQAQEEALKVRKEAMAKARVAMEEARKESQEIRLRVLEETKELRLLAQQEAKQAHLEMQRLQKEMMLERKILQKQVQEDLRIAMDELHAEVREHSNTISLSFSQHLIAHLDLQREIVPELVKDGYLDENFDHLSINYRKGRLKVNGQSIEGDDKDKYIQILENHQAVGNKGTFKYYFSK